MALVLLAPVLAVAGCSSNATVDSSGPHPSGSTSLTAPLPSAPNSEDVAYAKQLAAAACEALDQRYHMDDPVADPSLSAFRAYSELFERLAEPETLAAKASGLDPIWSPVAAYIRAERAFWDFTASLHADGKYTRTEKADAESNYAETKPRLDELVQGLNRSCAAAGYLIETGAMGFSQQ